MSAGRPSFLQSMRIRWHRPPAMAAGARESAQAMRQSYRRQHMAFALGRHSRARWRAATSADGRWRRATIFSSSIAADILCHFAPSISRRHIEVTAGRRRPTRRGPNSHFPAASYRRRIKRSQHHRQNQARRSAAHLYPCSPGRLAGRLFRAPRNSALHFRYASFLSALLQAVREYPGDRHRRYWRAPS